MELRGQNLEANGDKTSRTTSWLHLGGYQFCLTGEPSRRRSESGECYVFDCLHTSYLLDMTELDMDMRAGSVGEGTQC